MEKYGTYRVFKNSETGEVIRKPLDLPKDDLEKLASSSQWVELEEDPQDE